MSEADKQPPFFNDMTTHDLLQVREDMSQYPDDKPFMERIDKILARRAKRLLTKMLKNDTFKKK